MKFENNTFFINDPEILSRARLCVGLLFLFRAFYVVFFANPESLSTGNWSWVYRSITELFGPYGYPIFHAIIGLAFIAWSLRNSSSND